MSLVTHTAAGACLLHTMETSIGVLLPPPPPDEMLVHRRLPPAFCQVTHTVHWYAFILLGGERAQRAQTQTFQSEVQRAAHYTVYRPLCLPEHTWQPYQLKSLATVICCQNFSLIHTLLRFKGSTVYIEM